MRHCVVIRVLRGLLCYFQICSVCGLIGLNLGKWFMTFVVEISLFVDGRPATHVSIATLLLSSQLCSFGLNHVSRKHSLQLV